MKKVYTFYLYDSRDPEFYHGIDYDDIHNNGNIWFAFYAWTPNKEVRERFRSMRDMTKFKEIKREMDDDEFREFSNQRERWLLEDRGLTTSFISNSKYTTDCILILSTGYEIDYVTFHEEEIISEVLAPNKETLYLGAAQFTNEIQKTLDMLGYEDVIYSIKPSNMIEPLPFLPYEMDRLSVYVKLFENTYRKDVDAICESMNFSKNQIHRKTLRD